MNTFVLYSLLILQSLILLTVIILFLVYREKSMKNIENKLDGISQIMTTPYLRGQAGEMILENLLGNWLPPEAYSLQYTFSSGNRPDAIIKMGRYKVAIDAKFNSESFSRLLEQNTNEIKNKEKQIILNQAEEIGNKYIRPEEGTLNFALMYIPSENLYYRLFVRGDGSLFQELFRLHVLPVSTSNLFLYLQTVSYGLKGMNFNEYFQYWMNGRAELDKNIDICLKQGKTSELHLKNLIKSWDDMYGSLHHVKELFTELDKKPEHIKNQSFNEDEDQI